MEQPTNPSNHNNKPKRMWHHITAFFSRQTKHEYILYVLYLLIVASLINIGIMTLHLLDDDYSFSILNHSYIDAIYPDQDINDVMYTDIVRIIEFDENTIEVGDKVVVYNDFNIPENWVESVVELHPETNQIEITYDDVTTITTRYDNIIGEYEHNASVFGTIYYTSKFTNGYVLLVLSHLFVIAAYYIGLVDKRK